MKILSWLLLLPAIVLVVAFAIANRGGVVVSLDPLPFSLAPPVYALVLVSVFIGLVIGGLATWIGGRKGRRLARRNRRELAQLQGRLKQTLSDQSPAPSPVDTPSVADAA